MEVSGLIMLKISDPSLLKIVLAFENNDDKGFQMQVKQLLLFSFSVRLVVTCIIKSWLHSTIKHQICCQDVLIFKPYLQDKRILILKILFISF